MPIFPPTEHVHYQRPPLIEVVGQIRFPAELRLETAVPADFQKAVRGTFPLASRRPASRTPMMPSGALSGPGGLIAVPVPMAAPIPQWDFVTEDQLSVLALLPDTLTLVTANYPGWARFRGMLEQGWTALLGLYELPFAVRIGLRYRDVILRSKLGLSEAKWNELLQPQILGELVDPAIAAVSSEVARGLTLSLPEHNAQVRIQHGFARINEESEIGYLIDCDFFVGRTELANVFSILEFLHSTARAYFRWCITDRLHDAMGPVSPK